MICFMNYSVSPYHHKRFLKLHQRFKDNIMFVELASKDKIYPWDSQAKEVNAITLFPGMEFSTVKTKEMVKSVNQLLDRVRPDVVISISYATSAMRAASIWARRNNAVSICVSDTWKDDKPRFVIFEMLKGIWCRYAYDGMFLSGTLSKAYYQGIGFPESRIWLGQNCVDNDFYTKQTSALHEKKEEYRSKYKLPMKYFLCVARLSPEKNLERLIRSFRLYKSMGGDWDLVIVGSGPMDQTLKNLVSKAEINKNVFFMGWKLVDEISVFYALASCLILPSVNDAWGNVVNEAMACSLPVLISNKCGCLPELCFKGVNGFDFDPYNEMEITNVMLKMSSEECNRLSMGQASLDLVRKYTLDNYSASLGDCIDFLWNLNNIKRNNKHVSNFSKT